MTMHVEREPPGGQRAVRVDDEAEATAEHPDRSYEQALAAVDELRRELARRREERRRELEPRGLVPPPSLEKAPEVPRQIAEPESPAPVAALSALAEAEAEPATTPLARGWIVAAATTVVALLAASLIGLLGGREPAPRERGAAAAPQEAPAAATDSTGRDGGAKPSANDPAANSLGEVFFHETAGYGFRYPTHWSLQRAGEVARVISPDGTRVVSFALGPIGPESFDSFSSLLERSYDDVRISRYEPVSLEGESAVVLRGRATSPSADELVFRALVVVRPERRAVGAFAAARLRAGIGDVAAIILRSLRVEH
jgi:hypothetical protein